MTSTPESNQLSTSRTQRRAALVEDAEWMARTGETMPGAAARLHVRPDWLRESLKRAGRPDLWARLVTNADPGYAGPRGVIRDSSGRTRRAA